MPLVHLMDLEPHRGWYALEDPQGKAVLPGGGAVSGEVFLELKLTVW